MQVVHFIYSDQTVDFLPKGDINVMVNATQMAKIFGKEVKHFNENDGTEKFIDACLKSRNSDFLGIKNREDLIISKQKSGTWMHRILALKFAAWLDPDFEVWVFMTIDKILLGHFHEQREATKAKLTAKQKLEMKRRELLEKYPEAVEYFDLEHQFNDAENRRRKAIKDSVKQLELDLFPIKN